MLLANDLQNLNDREMVRLLLYGHEKLLFHANQNIVKATINDFYKLEKSKLAFLLQYFNGVKIAINDLLNISMNSTFAPMTYFIFQ